MVRYTTIPDGEWYEAVPIIDDNGLFSGFEGKQNAVQVVLPEDAGITSIGNDALKDCQSLVEITLPESGLSSIVGRAFEGCTNLQSIVIPDTVTEIGYSAFGDCHALTDITLPDAITSIGQGAFISCSNLTNISLPSNLT